jgi:hypothetical protein
LTRQPTSSFAQLPSEQQALLRVHLTRQPTSSFAQLPSEQQALLRVHASKKTKIQIITTALSAEARKL